MKRTLAATLICVTALAAACTKQEKSTGAAEATAPKTSSAQAAVAPVTSTAAPAAPAMPPVPQAAATAVQKAGTTLSGKIVETFDGAGYTYLRLKTEKGDEWAAVREVPVKKGQTVTVNVDMVAQKFKSAALKRTFDRITFGNVGTPGAAPAASAKMPPNHPPTGGIPQAMVGMMGTPADHMKVKVTGPISVEKAEGSSAKTIAEVWADRSSLGGKPVVIRGKVVKFLGGIMGSNWLHIRDGSGSEKKGDHDLTVTTSETAVVGDVVTVRGVVSTDKDFGAGYRYPVIVENGKLAK